MGGTFVHCIASIGVFFSLRFPSLELGLAYALLSKFRFLLLSFFYFCCIVLGLAWVRERRSRWHVFR
jgi:hypothetical protein